MNLRHAIRRLNKSIAGVFALTLFVSHTVVAQPGGTIQQGLVAGSSVSAETQQKMGLVALSTGCSGALIRQNWVLTAAHCVDKVGGPGGFTTMAAANLTVTLNGTGLNPERRQAQEIITFRPSDVAIVRVQPAFNGNDFNNREIYTGDMTNKTIRLFGRGINEFSSNGNPSKSDGTYRDGFVDVVETTPTTYTFNARGGVMVAGGDSGGPSFVKGRSSSAFGATDMIAGVHSLCNVLCADGKHCSIGAPNPWQWVTSVPTCADAAIAPLWPQISKLLEPSFLNQTFDTSLSKDGFNILYTVSQDGTLTWRKHDIHYANRNSVAEHTFTAPKTVGSGWAGGHRDVMAMGQMGIYSLLDDGTLRWNWHLGFADGSYKWRDSRDIGKGLNGFTQIVAQDQGVLYGRIQGDPGIFWGMTTNYDAKKGPPSAAIGLRLTAETINFAAFKTIFAGGKGVLYAIDYAGNLLWMKHLFYQSPIPDPGFRIPGNSQYELWRRQWIGPVVIASGLTNVTQAFSPGEGHIYYITESGALVWRRHVGWKDGTPKWDSPNSYVIANGWGGYKFAFARNTTSDLGSGNPALEIIVNE